MHLTYLAVFHCKVPHDGADGKGAQRERVGVGVGCWAVTGIRLARGMRPRGLSELWAERTTQGQGGHALASTRLRFSPLTSHMQRGAAGLWWSSKGCLWAAARMCNRL
jgi:hypothetical protein